MKTISLWQPWATLIAIEAKQYETRSWAIRGGYRGPLAIHAAKRRHRDQIATFNREPFRAVLTTAGYNSFDDLPLGCIVCTVDLTAIYRTEEILPHISAHEKAFGDYTPGRRAWRLENVRILEPPIPAKGQQGLWEWNQ